MVEVGPRRRRVEYWLWKAMETLNSTQRRFRRLDKSQWLEMAATPEKLQVCLYVDALITSKLV